MKEERSGGRKDRRIESRDEEDAGEWWRHRKNNQHKGGKSNQVVTKFYQKNLSSVLLQIAIYRVWRGRMTGTRRVASHFFVRTVNPFADVLCFSSVSAMVTVDNLIWYEAVVTASSGIYAKFGMSEVSQIILSSVHPFGSQRLRHLSSNLFTISSRRFAEGEH